MNILLIPGINNTARTFDGVVANLPAGLTGIAVDCPALNTVEAVAEALLAEAPEKFIACGHSFGGYVALAMLDLAPERLAGIALINSNDWADSETLAATREQKAVQALGGAYEELANAASARAYHPDNAGRADLLEERAAGLLGYGAERYAAHSRACAARPDRGALLAATDLPKIVIVADQDGWCPRQNSWPWQSVPARHLPPLPPPATCCPPNSPPPWPKLWRTGRCKVNGWPIENRFRISKEYPEPPHIGSGKSAPSYHPENAGQTIGPSRGL
ncbi:MAG: alpha/beta fold hydrolase [Pikeienuella sp.]